MPSKYGFGNTRKKSPYEMGKAHYGKDQKNPVPMLKKDKVTTKINPDGTITKSKGGKSSTYSVDPKNPKRYVNPKGGEFFVKK